MSHTVLVPLQSKEFDRFLYAPVGEEENGMTLSVLSALARLNVDPWEETAALAAIPKDRARLKLAAMIGATTKVLRNAPSAEATAARLIDLLPGAAATMIVAHVIPLQKSSPSSVATIVVIGVLIVIAYATAHFGTWPFSTAPLSHSDKVTNSASSP